MPLHLFHAFLYCVTFGVMRQQTNRGATEGVDSPAESESHSDASNMIQCGSEACKIPQLRHVSVRVQPNCLLIAIEFMRIVLSLTISAVDSWIQLNFRKKRMPTTPLLSFYRTSRSTPSLCFRVARALVDRGLKLIYFSFLIPFSSTNLKSV